LIDRYQTSWRWVCDVGYPSSRFWIPGDEVSDTEFEVSDTFPGNPRGHELEVSDTEITERGFGYLNSRFRIPGSEVSITLDSRYRIPESEVSDTKIATRV
jgi:hypothetical protein